MKIAAAVSIAFTILISVTGCASDDDEAPVESRIKNSTGYDDDIHSDLRNPILDLRGERLDINDPFDDDGIYTPRMDYDDKLDLMRHHIDDDIFKGMYEDTDLRGEPEPPVDPSYLFGYVPTTFDEEGNLIRE
jgi:hypothetical protein